MQIGYTKEEAQQVIRDDSASPRHWVLAAATFAELSKDESPGWDDLLECLKRSGLVAETAATTLYTRTKRPRDFGLKLEGFSTDFGDWMQYLQEHGF